MKIFWGGLEPKIRTTLIVVALMGLLYVPAWAIINRIVGGNVIPGWGVVIDNDSTEVNITQVWTDSLWEMVYEMIDTTTAPVPYSDSTDLITHDRIRDWHFADDDWGDLSVATNVVTIDEDVIEAENFADEDWGDMTVATNSITLDADVVADNEIDYSAVTLDDFDYQTAWRVFYSNADGDVTELALGGDGTYLRSNGASAAPTFTTPGGAGDITAVGDITTGDAFTATAGSDGTTLYFEGSTGDGNELALTTADPGSDITVTIPATAGNLWVDAQTDIINDTHVDWGVGANQVSATDMTDFGTMTATSGNVLVADGGDFESVAMSGDVTIATGGATSIGDDKVTEADLKVTGGAAVDEDILTYDSDVGDFMWQTPAELGLATESAMGDSVATHYIQRFVWPVHAIEYNISGDLRVLFPVRIGNYDWVVRYTSAANDTKDTAFVFSFRLPMGCDDDGLDTIAFNARTTGAAVGDASIEVMVYKRTSDGGAKTAIDSLAEFNTAGAWQHKTITGFTTNASPGDWISVEMIINCDATDDSVYHDHTYGWYTGM